MSTTPPNQSAAANRRPAGHSDGSDNLAALVASDRAFPAVVAELGRSATPHAILVSTPLLNSPMHDGSRQFAELPGACSWDGLRRHIERLPGATVTDYLTDNVTEMWLDFSFRGHAFTVNNPYGDFWFLVRDPTCPDDVLVAVIDHCVPLLLLQSV